MSTSAVSPAIDPNDPRLTEPQDITFTGALTKPQAIRLQELGLSAKARANEDCYENVHIYRCKNNHMWPIPETCHQRYCPKCAERLAKLLIDEYDTLDIGNEDFLYIEISRPYIQDLTTEGPIRDFNSTVGDGFKVLNKSTTALLGTLWHSLIVRGRLVSRLMLWGDGVKSSQRYRNAWPGTAIKVSLRPTHQFHDTLHQVFAPCLPKDPIACAEYEAIFHNTRQVHTMGDIHRRPPTIMEVNRHESLASQMEQTDSELFPTDQEIGNNSDPRPLKVHISCPHCHEPATHMTGRKPASAWHKPKVCFRWYTDYATP